MDRTRLLRLGSFLLAALALASAVFAAAGAPAASAARHKRHPHHPSCSSLLPLKTINSSIAGGTPFSLMKIFHTPYVAPRTAPKHLKLPESACWDEWTQSQVPADEIAIYGTPTGNTQGGALEVVYGMPSSHWRWLKADIDAGGAGDPQPMPPHADSPLNLGKGSRAFLESVYSGTGPTYNTIEIYALSKHHNYLALYFWDATLAEDVAFAKQVLGSPGF